MSLVTVNVPYAPEPFACIRRSGITSRSKCPSFSRNHTSCSSIGPRGPAVTTLLLSTTGAPAMLVSLPSGKLRLGSPFPFTVTAYSPLAASQIGYRQLNHRRLADSARRNPRLHGPGNPTGAFVPLHCKCRLMTSVQNPVVLESAAYAVMKSTATPPFTYQLGPQAARDRLVDLQSGPTDKLPVDEEWVTVPAAVGDVRFRLVRPRGVTEVLPIVVYMRGGGWVLGDAATHDRLIRELACGARAAIAFVEYSRSPEARYPVAIEQGYATARWLTDVGLEIALD